jgi:membrane protease YdiL (CAAX protease family)
VVLFVLYGLRLRKLTLKELIGPRKLTLMNVVRDLGIALLFFIGSNIILGIVALIVRAGHNPAIRKISPSGAAAIILYLLVSLSAGICEEIVCRGYLQKQLIGLTKSTSAGILLQGIIFGAAHGYQGTKFMIVIGVYGCLFGLLAQFRNSLYPGMMTHALQDGIAGLIVRNMAR